MINARPAERPPLRASSPAEPCSAGAGFLQAVKAWWQSLWTTPHQDQPALRAGECALAVLRKEPGQNQQGHDSDEALRRHQRALRMRMV